VLHSAVTFLWVAVVERMTWRYAERGDRYLLLDAGHVCQNLYLAAEALGCGVCAIAAYDDALLNAELGLDGENLFVIYLASLGVKSTG
jgi:SagB-type dehydrogenase family enzyme